MRQFCKKLLLNVIFYLVPVLIFASIWIPVIYHYYVPGVRITEEMIDNARHTPSDSELDEIQYFSQSIKNRDIKKLIVAAERTLQGNISIPGYPSIRLRMPFDPDDIDKGSKGWQLAIASFKIPKLLLSAYEASGRDDFLMTARDIILAWGLYERKAWLPKGFLWNDHAIAARISVLAKFWKHYRNHPDYEVEVAKAIFQLVARSARLLAKPSHFTFSSNHGIMQNLALWQICLAFPVILDVEFYNQLALERMRDQMIFYINDEGVVLEHSAQYQRLGLNLIALAFRYLTLLNMPIPEELEGEISKGKGFLCPVKTSRWFPPHVW